MTSTPTLHTFDFAGLELRVIMHLAEPWFVALDACKALGLATDKGFGKHAHGIADSERRLTTMGAVDPHLTRGANRGGPRPGTKITLLSESGLYKLIMRSDKPEARKFQDWVTREVLPSIRLAGPSFHEGIRKIVERWTSGLAPRGVRQQRYGPFQNHRKRHLAVSAGALGGPGSSFQRIRNARDEANANLLFASAVHA